MKLRGRENHVASSDVRVAVMIAFFSLSISASTCLQRCIFACQEDDHGATWVFA